MFPQILADFRHSIRQMRLSPAFALLAVVTLALGIGANTALFSVVHAILIKDLPYREPESIVRVWMDNRRLQMKEDWASWANYQDYKRLGTSLDQMVAFSLAGVNLTSDGEPERVSGVRSEAALFDLLGVSPVLGRLFHKDEEAAGKENVFVISWSLWQRRFGGSRDVIGKKLEMDGRSVNIIGVMPAGFGFPMKDTDFWTPLVVTEGAKGRVGYWLQMAARLKPGVTIEKARAEMDVVGKQLEQQYPNENASYGVFVNPLVNHVAGNTRTPLLILLGAVGFVLLIACVNVAGLMVARAEARGREVALRAALGAGRLRLAIMMLLESFAMTIIAGAVGILVAWWGIKGLVWMAPPDLPRLDEIRMNLPVMLFAIAVTSLTALLAGLIPALRVSQVNLNHALREGGRSVMGHLSGQRVRAALVISECMLAIMLLAGAGLLLRSLSNLRAVDPGFRTENVLTLQVGTSRTINPQRPQVAEFYRRLLERLRGLPGVTGVGAISTLMLSDTPNSGDFTLEDRPPFPPSEQIEATQDTVSPGLFEAMKVKLKYGRFFEDRDQDGAPRIAIINDTFAKRYWPGRDPVGLRFVYGTPGDKPRWITIVGVVDDMHRLGLHRPARLETFLPLAQAAGGRMQLMVTANGDPLALAGAVRSEIRALDKLAPVARVSTVEAEMGESIAARKFQALLLTMLAGLALVLAAVGIFGLMYQAVAKRTQEIGVRMALGAGQGSVVNMVLREGMLLTCAGVVLGLLGALGLSRLISGLLFGIGATDPLTYAAAALVLGITALFACWLPARRAARVDPMVALRNE